MIRLPRLRDVIDCVILIYVHQYCALNFAYSSKEQINDCREYQSVESDDLCEEPVLQLPRSLAAVLLRFEVLRLCVEDTTLVEED